MLLTSFATNNYGKQGEVEEQPQQIPKQKLDTKKKQLWKDLEVEILKCEHEEFFLA